MLRHQILGVLDRIDLPGRDRVVDRLLAGSQPFSRTLSSGIRMHIDPADRIERRFAIRSYERPLLRYLKRTLRPGDVVVDGGAHVGYIALHAAIAVGNGGVVVAVEPDPQNIERLRANIDLNRLPVRVEQAALSDQVGSARFTRDLTPGETGWGSLLADASEHSDMLDVATTTIDAIAARLPGQRVAVIKLDVQGTEYDALIGGSETLQRHRPAVIVETVDVWWGTRQTKTVADVRELLTAHGLVERTLARNGSLVDPKYGSATSVFVPD